jgi:hypothetical protein
LVFFDQSLWTALAARFRLTIASFRDAKKLTGAAPVTFNRPRKGGWNHAKMPLCGATLVTMVESGDFRHRNNSPHVRRLDRARFRYVFLQSKVRPAPMIVIQETLPSGRKL